MSWTESFLLLATASVCLFLLHKLGPTVFLCRPRPEVLAKLATVGDFHKSPFSFIAKVITPIISTRELANEGYLKINKALKQPYSLPTPWVTAGAVMVLPPSVLPLLMRPDKTIDGEWTNLHGLIETTQLPYIVPDPNIYQNVLHFDVVRRKMANRDMGRLAPAMADEIDRAFCDIWGTRARWETINAWDACGRVISRASQRILIGLPLSRDERLLETSRQYANSLLVGGAIINCFPSSLRWLIGPLVSLRARYFQARFVKMLVPVVEERIRKWQTDKDNGPDDFMQWMIPMCAKEGPDQLDATRIALRLISLLTPLIFAICYVFAHCVLDIHKDAYKSDVLAGLEEECMRVAADHNGLQSSESINALYRIDSVLRESMRLSDVAVTNLFRDVTAGEVDVGNGLRVGPGVRMVFPTQNVHRDADNYESPTHFKAFRFSQPFEGMDGKREQELITSTTPSFLPFGYGRHACPGRWFASQLMKQALAYIVMHYEIELVGKPIKRKALLNTMIPPVDAQVRVRRRL